MGLLQRGVKCSRDGGRGSYAAAMIMNRLGGVTGTYLLCIGRLGGGKWWESICLHWLHPAVLLLSPNSSSLGLN